MESNDHRETAGDTPRRNRRRQYVVNPAVQWKYAVTIALAVFLLSSVLSLVLYGLLHHQARLRSMNPGTYTAEVTLVIFLFGLAFSTLTAGAVGVWCIIATHRICGPLFVLEGYLRELARGRIPKPRPLRRKDEFKDLYATFSDALESLEVKKQAEISMLTEALAIAKSAADSDDETRRNALRSVAHHIEALRNAASQACGSETEEMFAAPMRTLPSNAEMPVGAT